MTWDNSARLPAQQARARVLIIYVGGTLGMQPLDPRVPGSALANVGPLQLAELLAPFGVDEGIAWQLTCLHDLAGHPLDPVDSSQVGPDHWLCMAAMLEQHYANFDGFVILHGTDTLAYTASALSFLCVNLGKPVVITGSQLPLFQLRSDARHNIAHALLIAGASAVGLPIVPEVVVCFGDALLRGNRARKASTSGWQGFISPNYPPLGLLGESLRIHTELLRPAPEPGAAFYVGRSLQRQVLDLTLFPGIQARQVEALLGQPQLKGLVLRAYGAGNAPEDPELLDCLGQAVQAGQTILVISQCQEGRVDLGRYASSRGLLQRQVASGFDLTPEAALTKLMWLLASETGSELRAQLQQDQRGEQSFARREVSFPIPPMDAPQSEWILSARATGAVGRQGLEAGVLHLVWRELTPCRLQVYLNDNSIWQQEGLQGGCLSEVTLGLRRYMVDDRPFRLRLSCDSPISLIQAELLLTHQG